MHQSNEIQSNTSSPNGLEEQLKPSRANNLPPEIVPVHSIRSKWNQEKGCSTDSQD